MTAALLDYSPPAGWLTAGDDAEYHTRTDRAIAWFAEHKVDGTTVPIAGPVELDPRTREWRITQHVRGDGGLKVDPDGEVTTRVLRRAVKSLPPWVTP